MRNEMSTEEIEDFLSTQGHGVLVFADDNPYGIPISFGFHNSKVIMQLFSTDESRKEVLLSKNNTVSLVVYEVNSPFDWKSVIINGELVEFDEIPSEQDLEIFATDASTVDLSIFNKEDDTELEGTWYSLELTNLTAYQSPVTDE